MPKPEPRRFVTSNDEYRNMAWSPGNESCWSSVPGLSFGRCCNDTRLGGNAACWARGKSEGLSFQSCCSSASLRPSPLPRQRRAVAMVSTTPFRVLELEQVLSSLAHQTHRLDAIYLAVPFVFHRDWTWYNIPWWYIMLDPLIRIIRCEQDYRAETGLLCALRHEPDPDTYILLIDDDIVYHPMLMENLLRESTLHPGAMVGSMAYGRPGIWCRTLDKNGVCIEPNLVHSTYGILLQRRFFDAGVFNFAAAAHAHIRQRPDLAEPFDYVVTCCMIQDNLWFEAHLARKGVPRVFLQTDFGARPVANLAFGRGALFSGYKETYHFYADDPHTIDAAEKLCMRALAALWGPTLWVAKQRRVAAAVLPAGAKVAALATMLSSLGWFMHEAVVVFACTRRSFAHWRRLITQRGGRLEAQVSYLHQYALEEEAKRRAPFLSEPFDPEALTPELLDTVALPDGRRGFRPSSAVPGRPLAGTVLPLVDIVELCPAPLVPEELPPDPGRCPHAQAIRNSCSRDGRGPRVVEDMPAGGYASVRCCHDGPDMLRCFPNWMWRNITWWLSFQFGSCFPSSATYMDAYRTCEAVGMRLCNDKEVLDCCDKGCEVNNVAWLRSPATASCVLQAARAARPLGPVAPRAPSAGASREPSELDAEGPRPEAERLLATQDAFLEYSEEARSTVVQWITPRGGL